jgi:uroporphyrinogen decarboxylase
MPNEREKFQRQMALDGDPVVKSHLGITYPVWKEFGEKLNWLEGFSEHVHVGISRSSGREANSEVTDRWGCHWVYPLESLDGICDGHPLESWDELSGYRPPDPDEFTDWEEARKNVERSHGEGRVASGGTDHGFIFLRLTYLRGFDNCMLDMGEEKPELEELIRLVEEYWMGVAQRWIDVGVDTIGFGDDLGLQHALPISPAAWRRYIKPSFARIHGSCREQGVHVSQHTDGYILDIIPDLIECGVSVLNPQDLVNGLDNLARLAKGKVVLNLDIDRQDTTVFGTPEQSAAHVRQCVEKLGSPTGGLSTVWGVYPGTPLANIEAVARTMDECATMWCS